MASLFIPIKFKTSIQLNPGELDEHFEEHLIEKLQTQYEGVCSRYGFIKPGSIQIVERSMGQLMKPHFNGHIRFEMCVIAEVCNPTEGMIITAIVKNKNQLGILAESHIQLNDKKYPVLDIIIPKRTAGISSEIGLEALQVGDTVYVEILGKRYQLNDKKISIIGRGVVSNKSSRKVQAEDIDGDGIEYDEDDGDADPEEELEELEGDGEEEELDDEQRERASKVEIPFIEEENPFASDEEEEEELEDDEEDLEEDDELELGDYVDDN
jgi:DNA-directed RNA polymerase subunit E'/Rpb7